MKKIFLLGDSIRIGYDKYVRMAFEEVAEVYYPNGNCRFASNILRHLPDWKEKTGCGNDVDLVHWNTGIWDALVMLDGDNHTPLDVYKIYIERLCRLIKILFPKAKMIFATSTVVREELFIRHKLYNKDIDKYNETAVEIVKRYGGEINDLCMVSKGMPVGYYSDHVHFYTKEGTRVLTNQVVSCIEGCLDIQSKKLDYDALFKEEQNILGV